MSTEYSLPQNTTDKFVVENNEHLSAVIKHCIEKYGNECNLNFLDVSNVIDMSGMFKESQFNGDISNWDVSNVTGMRGMFENSEFNGDISNWDINGDCDYEDVLACCPCTKCPSEFEEWLDEDSDEDFDEVEYTLPQNTTDKFVVEDKEHQKAVIEHCIEKYGNECDLNFLDVSNVTNMSYMFAGSIFTGDISNWDVSNVTDMSGMFENSEFTGDISNWDVSNVTDMCGMFEESQFTGDISNWDVSNVTSMGNMFKNSQFTGDISNWDVSNVTSMSWMFANSEFTGDISNWDVSSVSYWCNVLKDCPCKKYPSKFDEECNWENYLKFFESRG